jgi:type II secretion system protein G
MFHRKSFSSRKKAFTLIELLVVIAIIGLLATLSVVSFGEAQKKARDAKRMSDIKQIQTALEMYKDEYGAYPENSDNDYGGYDVAYNNSSDTFIEPLSTAGIIQKTPKDPKGVDLNTTYVYYYYGAGDSGCDVSRGRFYILAITNLESLSVPSPASPGWSCPSRDWSTAGGLGLNAYTPDYVTGGFTK